MIRWPRRDYWYAGL